MTKADRLQITVNKAFGQGATVLRSNEDTVLLRYLNSGEYWEYVTAKYNDFGLYSGNYYPCKYTDKAVANKQATTDYFERIKWK